MAKNGTKDILKMVKLMGYLHFGIGMGKKVMKKTIKMFKKWKVYRLV